MKTIMTIMIVVGILAALFMLLSGFLIVCIAWTHKPISVWQMLKNTSKSCGAGEPVGLRTCRPEDL